MQIENVAPLAIGGVGGSGTRVVAELGQKLGLSIGADLNEPLDNLWFTLLFKRRSILIETDERFAFFCDLFWERMGGDGAMSPAARDALAALARMNRIRHDSKWLMARVESWLNTPATPGVAWAWKEPNTHVVIDRLLDLKPDLRYVHVLRNPIEMAVSANQNQLENWGHVFLDRDVVMTPRDSLSYNCSVLRRIIALKEQYSGRIMIVDFSRLCAAPDDVSREIASFAGMPIDDATSGWFTTLVRTGAPLPGRAKAIDRGIFDPADVAFAETMGFTF